MTLDDLLTSLPMNVWPTSPVSQVPVVRLRQWSIVRVVQNSVATLHLCGYDLTEGQGRVSSALQTLAEGEATTKSGRAYILEGPEGYPDSDALYVLDCWLRLQDPQSWEWVAFAEAVTAL